MEFSETSKGKPVVIYKRFDYILSYKNADNVKSWRCRKFRQTRCPAVLRTQHNLVLKEPTSHSHESYPQKIEVEKVFVQMKRDMAAVGATPRNVMGANLQDVSEEVMAHMPKKSSIFRSLLNHKQTDHQLNPTTTNFVIPPKYSAIVLYDSGATDPQRILAFGDKELVNELDKELIIGDGTFDKAPVIFFQLYTWHAKVGSSYPPCIYFLLTGKTLDIYERMFHVLQSLVPNLSPKTILVDFEKGCMSAATRTFPSSEVKGCYFHLCQSLLRKVASLGLKQIYENDGHMKLKIKSLAALSFVPENEVRTLFSDVAAALPSNAQYDELISYFSTTYIEGVANRPPMFPVNLWNHYNAARDASPRTTNACEGYHNALNSMFHCSHPSIWKLLDGLQRDMAVHKLTVANAATGRSEPKKKKYLRVNDAVKTAVNDYANVPNKLVYLQRLANLQ